MSGRARPTCRGARCGWCSCCCSTCQPLSLESALAYGGKVSVTRCDSGWQVLAEAPRLKVDPALWEVLTEPRAPAEIGAAQVHFALVPDALARQGRRLITEIGDTTIRLTF
jgi:histidine phosphotransferase ChpT